MQNLLGKSTCTCIMSTSPASTSRLGKLRRSWEDFRDSFRPRLEKWDFGACNCWRVLTLKAAFAARSKFVAACRDQSEPGGPGRCLEWPYGVSMLCLKRCGQVVTAYLERVPKTVTLRDSWRWSGTPGVQFQVQKGRPTSSTRNGYCNFKWNDLVLVGPIWPSKPIHVTIKSTKPETFFPNQTHFLP